MHNISSQILLNESPTTLSKTLVSLDNVYNNQIIRVCIGMVKQKMTLNKQFENDVDNRNV